MRPAEDVIVRGENGENTEERSVIRSINETAFGGPGEADLVDKLRTANTGELALSGEHSLVARFHFADSMHRRKVLG